MASISVFLGRHGLQPFISATPSPRHPEVESPDENHRLKRELALP